MTLADDLSEPVFCHPSMDLQYSTYFAGEMLVSWDEEKMQKGCLEITEEVFIGQAFLEGDETKGVTTEFWNDTIKSYFWGGETHQLLITLLFSR